jgi:hypothetical protein
MLNALRSKKMKFLGPFVFAIVTAVFAGTKVSANCPPGEFCCGDSGCGTVYPGRECDTWQCPEWTLMYQCCQSNACFCE